MGNECESTKKITKLPSACDYFVKNVRILKAAGGCVKILTYNRKKEKTKQTIIRYESTFMLLRVAPLIKIVSSHKSP